MVGDHLGSSQRLEKSAPSAGSPISPKPLKSNRDDHLAWIREQERAHKILLSSPSPDRSVGIIVFGHLSTAYLK
jgi:hypothetical protein